MPTGGRSIRPHRVPNSVTGLRMLFDGEDGDSLSPVALASTHRVGPLRARQFAGGLQIREPLEGRHAVRRLQATRRNGSR